MKSILLVLSLICVTLHVNAQYYDDVLTYTTATTPVNGVKIKTNLPFTNSSQMPTIMIEGYAYLIGEPINLTLNYFIYDNVFTKAKVSTAGSHNPTITLAAENGKVVIFIDSKIFFQRFHIRAFAFGNGEQSTWFTTGWSAVDSTLSGTATANYVVPYQNKFAGSLTTNLGAQQSINPAIRFNSTDNHFMLLSPSLGAANYNNIVQAGDNAIIYAGSQFGNGSLCISPWDNTVSGIRIDSNGNVGIGTPFPKSYKLAVEGTIGARRLKITQQATWADFVFQSDYQLPSLQDVENYINTNKHLSGIPSESEVKKEGIDVGEMNKLLLQKVEELTLYMIEEHKQKQKMQDQIDALQREMKSVKNK